MEAVVSNILQSRKREPDGLRKTAIISLAAHAGAIAIILLIPSVMPRAAQVPRVVTTISLGGSPGPKTDGVQQISAKPIQAAQPSADPQIAKNTLPSVAQTPPKMALPDPKQKPRTPQKPTAASKDPKGTAVGKGFETRAGTAKVETGARGEGFGLSSGGTDGDGGVRVEGNFCCPEYLVDLRNRVQRNWNERQQASGSVTMKFTIQRSGLITDIEVNRGSGNPTLDIASQRALIITKTLAPLPAAYTERQLTVYVDFEYRR